MKIERVTESKIYIHRVTERVGDRGRDRER